MPTLQSLYYAFRDKSYNIQAKEEDYLTHIGQSEDICFGKVLAKYNHPYDKDIINYSYKVYKEIIKEEVFYDSFSIMNSLKDKGYKIAIASGARKEKLYANIGALNIPDGFCDFIISGDDLLNNKSDPKIYLKCTKALKLNASECLVVNSLSGINAANMSVLLLAFAPINPD